MSAWYVSSLWEDRRSRFTEYPRLYVAPSCGIGIPPSPAGAWTVSSYGRFTSTVTLPILYRLKMASTQYLHVTCKRGFMSVTRMMKWAFYRRSWYRYVFYLLQPMVSRQCWPPWGGSRASMAVSWPQGQGRAHAYSHGKGTFTLNADANNPRTQKLISFNIRLQLV